MNRENESILDALNETPRLLKECIDEIEPKLYKKKIIKGKWSIHEHATHIEDDYINGNSYRITGSATTYQKPFGDFEDSGKLMRDTTALRIELHSLSQELYHFYISHAAVLVNQNDIYSEPTPIYSNIENGLGLFGGDNITIVESKIEY